MYSETNTSVSTHRNPTPQGVSLTKSDYETSEVGFPIRKSSGQSLFATHRRLSQRTTSFIASQRQGIHRMLLRHLIALTIDAHRTSHE